MRIIHILNHILNVGNGIVNVAVDLACAQSRSGHSVAIVSSGGHYELLLKDFNVQHFHLDQKRRPQNLLTISTRYRKIIREFNPDIVHAHMMTGVLISKVFKINFEYKIISTIHNEFQRSSILMGVADHVVAVSEAVSISMQKRGISPHKIHVVRNGTIGSPRTKPISQYSPANLSRPSITTVAGMYRRKGIYELIQAFILIADKFSSAHLYLVGDGPDRILFEDQANKSPFADRIHFEGFKPEPQGYLRSTDIFVLASHKDPSPLVIPEAREAGCAIIATNVDGIPEALNYGAAGCLIEPKSISDLSNILEKMLGSPLFLESQRKASMSDLEYLNISRVNDEITIVYNKALR
jgi:glycosyltransferase involved in cell wall biosynthesis